MQFVFSQDFSQDFSHKIIFEERIRYPVTTYLIWDMIPSIKDDPLMQAASKNFDICHVVTIILKHDGYGNFSYYETSADNEEINILYINNFHVLNIFLLYFAERHRFRIEGRPLTWDEKIAEKYRL